MSPTARLSPSKEIDDTVQIILQFKNKILADNQKKQDQPKNTQHYLACIRQSRKLIDRDLNLKQKKKSIVSQQCVFNSFQCDLCDEGYGGFTRGQNRVNGHNQLSSAIAKHYKNVHGTIAQDLLKRF